MRKGLLAKQVRFYQTLCAKTYSRIQEGDEKFITAYKKAVDNPDPETKFQTFVYEGKLYASDERLLNHSVVKTTDEFENWYFGEYIINKDKYENEQID